MSHPGIATREQVVSAWLRENQVPPDVRFVLESYVHGMLEQKPLFSARKKAAAFDAVLAEHDVAKSESALGDAVADIVHRYRTHQPQESAPPASAAVETPPPRDAAAGDAGGADPEGEPSWRRLADFMSELSEERWSAGWLHDLEYILWTDLIVGSMRNFSAEQLGRLRSLSHECGGWVIWSDEANGETFVPLEQWTKLYAEHTR